MTQTTIYKPTFLQKFLGRNYKWWFILIYNLKRTTNYRIDLIAFRIGDFLVFGSIILAWQLQPLDRTDLEWKNLVTYFIIGNLIESMTRGLL